MRALAIPLILAVAVPTAACTAGDGGSSESTAERPFVIAGSYEVHSLDPTTAGGLFTRLEVAETLVSTAIDGTLEPGLATTWNVSEDQLEWFFELRETATFHDGSDVDAAAVAIALDRAHATEGTPVSSAPITAIDGDGDSVRISLSEPFSSLPAVVADTTGQILAPASYAADGSVTAIIGSGPYAVTEIAAPTTVVTTAAETWDGEAPEISDVRYESVGRAEARALMARSGDADLVLGMDPTALATLADAQGITTLSVTLPRTVLLKVNAGDPALEDPRVRQALSLALDRPGMADAILRDADLAATQLFPPSLGEWNDETVEPLSQDLERAQQLLASAGWELDENGMASKDGEPLVLSLRTFPDRPELPPIATAIQASLAEVGVQVEVLVGNSSEIPAAHANGSLDLALFSRNFALVPDPLVTLLTDLDPAGADWGAMNWQSAEVTAALGQLSSGASDSDAATARGTVTTTLQEELPLIPVAWYRQSAVLADTVSGLELDPLERSWRISQATWAE